MAKNAIRRALFAEIDQTLSSSGKKRIWQYFRDSCAYCGRRIDPSSREGHMDHLESHATGGDSHISNTVLACRFCNGDEKRETHWLGFLRAKCENDQEFEARRAHIETWVSSNVTTRKVPSSELRGTVEQQTANAVTAFEKALACIREAKRGAGLGPPG